MLCAPFITKPPHLDNRVYTLEYIGLIESQGIGWGALVFLLILMHREYWGGRGGSTEVLECRGRLPEESAIIVFNPRRGPNNIKDAKLSLIITNELL